MNWTDFAACRGLDTELSISNLPERISRRITEQDGHWIWAGQINNKGYGLIWARYPARPEKPGDKRPSHLVVWEILVGLVPTGLELDHLCPFKLCAHPRCLEPVTRAENLRRAGLRQTHCRKGGHPRTPENIYINPTSGSPSCRLCAQEKARARWARERGR